MNELTFLDIAILRKIDAESSVEKFGTLINTSFFETANLLGTVKIKGYIGIESSVGGISRVTITDAGSSILAVADQKAKEPLEPLDNAILHALAGGAKELDAMQQRLNVRSADLAFHINKLVSQGFMDYEVRSAKVNFVLTESGFNATGGVRVQQTLSETPGPSGLSEGAQKEEKALAPPWVNPSDVKKEEQAAKADVEHIMKEERAPAHRKPEHKKPLTPEEAKKLEEARRFRSKMEYYLVEYAPYIIMAVVVLLLFSAAIFLSLSKLG